MVLARPLLIAVLTLGISPVGSTVNSQNEGSSQERPQTRLQILVIDSAGHAVENLKKEDLQVFDDGNSETIEQFERAEGGTEYGLVIDGSGSLKDEYSYVLSAAQQLIAGNGTDDRTFIIRFVSSDKIKTIQEITSDKNLLIQRLAGLKTEMGQTALIDGLYLAAEYSMKQAASAPTSRKALVLISDGEDRASYYQPNALFSILAKSQLPVFTIGLVGDLDDQDGLVRLSPRRKASDFLTKLGKETGGRTFLLNSPKQLPDVVTEIVRDLHTQYVLSYRPSKNPNQKERKAQVKLVASTEHKKWTVILGRN